MARNAKKPWLIPVLTAACAVASGVGALAISNVGNDLPPWLTVVRTNPLESWLFSLILVIFAGTSVWLLEQHAQGNLHYMRPLSPRQLPTGWINRPAEEKEVINSVLGHDGDTVGITTALQGAGGFGKTTLAEAAIAHRRLQRRFRHRIYWVTLGGNVRGSAAIASKVNDVLRLLGDEVSFTHAEQAGQRLGALLDSRPRRLLVLDDVWSAEQLAPFLIGGKRCTRLVTTRIPSVFAGNVKTVKVDEMSREEARLLLTADLPPIDEDILGGLLEVTGRWPLLLRLANKILRNATETQRDISAFGQDLYHRLRVKGPAAVDRLTEDSGRVLDIHVPDDRARAVRTTIEASTSLLTRAEGVRFFELAIFAEDQPIPISLVSTLWQATGGTDDLTTHQLCARLADLALVSIVNQSGGALVLHDVVVNSSGTTLGGSA